MVYSQEQEDIINNLKDILLIIEDAHYSYEIWWILVSKDGRNKYFSKMLHYKEFFVPTARAHLASIVVNLYKLYETRDDTLSIPKIIKEAEKIKLLDSKQIAGEFKKAKELWIKICTLRNKYIAHKNYQLTKGAIYKEAKITPNQIKELIDISLIIFNKLWVCLGKQPHEIDEFTTRDTKKLFDDLLSNR